MKSKSAIKREADKNIWLERIIRFMYLKNDVISKVVPEVNYFTEQDEKFLRKFGYKRLKLIHDILLLAVTDGLIYGNPILLNHEQYPLDCALCPFCIIFNDNNQCCSDNDIRYKCPYAIEHGICTEYGSDYSKIQRVTRIHVLLNRSETIDEINKIFNL